MPMPKKFEDWTPPWVAKGEEFDEEQASRLIFNLETDKERLGTQKAAVTADRDAIAADRDAAATKRDELQAQIDEAARKGETPEQRADRLEREIAELKNPKTPPKTGGSDGDGKALKLEVAMDIEGISAAQAKTLAGYIQGNTKEELEASATAFVDQFGLPGATKAAGNPDEDGDDQDDDSPLRHQPRVRTHLDKPDRETGGEKPVRDLLDLIPRR